MNKRILWKALDGREVIIDTNELGLKNMEEVYAYIAELRKKYNIGEPNVMTIVGQVEDPHAIKVEQLPDHLQEQVKKSAQEAWEKPDPKKMN